MPSRSAILPRALKRRSGFRSRLEDATIRRLTRADVPSATDPLARFLIGMLVVRRLDDGRMLTGRIVETEAYPPEDPASHAFRGQTPRNRTMFGDALHAYIYFIYGSSYCLNVSSESAGVGAAVLIRALEPLVGIAHIRARRGATVADRDLLRGPGRICSGLDIDRRLDGIDLESDPRLWLADDDHSKPAVGVSSRIGLTRGAERQHRFYARGSRFLSGRRALSPGLSAASVVLRD
jgi:DNA-3-methyladenine glycosylase